MAFAFCDIHCDGTTAVPLDLRLTVGFVKHENDWVITHEHHSVPTKDEVLVGPDV
ncbi:nuclear transport factor 2 family protein [Mesorhizobium sp. IRAMC:0171]|uniref:Nuclear transport factor 2 family protein n=1 Tax=Mesorhizobium retamae TaxID=2912854 RepID=A0ABS9QEK0_9HYPH|nr:nuclear transport factor 2 family protein [Mesorhizobium sp. IRAMC:0171]